jgi:V-type H+-transporting ATPase subunit H
MKISGNPNDTVITKYAFYRAEEILGLNGDYDPNSPFGIRHAKIFTFGGVYLNDASLVKSLLSPDQDVQQSAGLIFASLLNVYEGSSDRLKEWIISKLVSVAEDAWEVAMPALTVFTRNNATRKAALVEAGVVANIAGIIKTLDFKGKTQQIYELCFVLWSLCLGDIDHTSYLSSGIIPILVDLLVAAPTRKIVRMTLATLRNLAATENEGVLNEMYTASLPKVLDGMNHNNFLRTVGDEEVEQDFKFLMDVLGRNFRELSSYERWTSQVYSGALRSVHHV